MNNSVTLTALPAIVPNKIQFNQSTVLFQVGILYEAHITHSTTDIPIVG